MKILGLFLIIILFSGIVLWMSYGVFRWILEEFGLWDNFVDWFVYDDKDYTMKSSLDTTPEEESKLMRDYEENNNVIF